MSECKRLLALRDKLQIVDDLSVYYVTYVFGMAGYSGNSNLLASSIQYIINVLMTLPALIWLDRWGRRKPMIIGAGLMSIFMFCNAAIMGGTGEVVPGGVNNIAVESMRVQGAPAKALIACTYLFVASYAPTWGPVSWVSKNFHSRKGLSGSTYTASLVGTVVLTLHSCRSTPRNCTLYVCAAKLSRSPRPQIGSSMLLLVPSHPRRSSTLGTRRTSFSPSSISP